MKATRSLRAIAVTAVLLAGAFARLAGAQTAEDFAGTDESIPTTGGTCKVLQGTKFCYFSGPNGSAGSYGIASGRDHDLWFGSPALNQIVQFSTKGQVVNGYDILSASAKPEGITLGPDKRMWFTEWNVGNVGAVNAAGGFAEYGLGISPSQAVPIVQGADKNLWIATDFHGIFKVTRNGTVSHYDLGSEDDAQPAAEALGSDGNVWFLEWNGVCSSGGGNYSSIGKITPTGKSTLYSVGQHGNGLGITNGPDGRIWFADPGGCDGYAARVGAIHTNGKGLVYYTKGVPAQTGVIINGGDGNLYFATYANQIGRITKTGKVTVWTLPWSPGWIVPGGGMCVGPDGNIWFVDSGNNRVGVMYLKK